MKYQRLPLIVDAYRLPPLESDPSIGGAPEWVTVGLMVGNILCPEIGKVMIAGYEDTVFGPGDWLVQIEGRPAFALLDADFNANFMPYAGPEFESWQQRLVNEASDLAVKGDKLYAFFNSEACQSLPEHERRLLDRQLSAMAEYSNVLRERMAAFLAPQESAA